MDNEKPLAVLYKELKRKKEEVDKLEQEIAKREYLKKLSKNEQSEKTKKGAP